MPNSNQMELGLDSKGVRRGAVVRRQNRLQRAQWWFKEMRRAVNSAIDWPPAPNGRPEQVYINLEAKRS
jgi:hypothetical protein